MGRMVAPPTILHLPMGPGGLLDSSANMDIDSSDDDRSVLSPTMGFLLCRKRPFKEEQMASVSRPKVGAPVANVSNPGSNVFGNSLASPIPELDEIEIDVDTGELLGVSTISSSIASNDAPQIVLQALATIPATKVTQLTPKALSISHNGGNDYGEAKTTREKTTPIERDFDDATPDSVSLSPSSTTGHDTVFDGKDLIVPSDPEVNEELGLNVPRPNDAVHYDCLRSDDPVKLSQPMNNLQHCASGEGSNGAATSVAEEQEALAQNDSSMAQREAALAEDILPTEEIDGIGIVDDQLSEGRECVSIEGQGKEPEWFPESLS